MLARRCIFHFLSFFHLFMCSYSLPLFLISHSFPSQNSLKNCIRVYHFSSLSLNFSKQLQCLAMPHGSVLYELSPRPSQTSLSYHWPPCRMTSCPLLGTFSTLDFTRPCCPILSFLWLCWLFTCSYFSECSHLP